MSDVVTLSSKLQIAIPRDLRRRLKLVPGQKIVIVEKDGVLHLIPRGITES
ncbi:MAG: AbrB/MazE/SpoVT family DNA-binding domain-containing protein [Candidatus Bathyarchaeia archaeon]